MAPASVVFDPADASVRLDPYPHYRRLLVEAPCTARHPASVCSAGTTTCTGCCSLTLVLEPVLAPEQIAQARGAAEHLVVTLLLLYIGGHETA